MPESYESYDSSPEFSVPVIAIGGSAGDLEALGRFFDAVPPDSGIAYVVVLHLAPDHESRLPEILDRRAGIPAENKERIFEHFWQGREGRRPIGIQGTVLGLSVVRDPAVHLGAEVELKGREGGGARFRVRVPPVLEVDPSRDGAGPDPE